MFLFVCPMRQSLNRCASALQLIPLRLVYLLTRGRPEGAGVSWPGLIAVKAVSREQATTTTSNVVIARTTTLITVPKSKTDRHNGLDSPSIRLSVCLTAS